MPTCLLIVNRTFLSDFDSLYGQVIHLKDKYDRVILLHPYKTEKVLEHIPIKVDKSISYFDTTIDVYEKKYHHWIDFYNAYDFNEHIDDIWLFGGGMSEGGKLKRKWPDQLDKACDKWCYMNFLSVSKLYTTLYMILKIANKYNSQIHELCYDPGEFSLALVEDKRIKTKKPVKVYHGYDIPALGIQKIDSFQEYLKNTSVDCMFESYDFVFGYSYITKEREQTHNIIQELFNAIDDSYEKKLFVKNKIDEIDTFIPRNEYIRHINNSKYTLIMPAYEKNCFSIYRLLESIYYDCIPLIHESCYITDVEKSYDIDLSDFIVNKDNINSRLAVSPEQFKDNLKYLKEKLFT